ncbi:MAG: GNAT family N-acetyltransferase [Clostridia bacterium]|nr:GNAT family N-acetyltransferase [Clostridia bacterium]NCC43355.1 GNAT family N-acetyltransferase [Clostridia bacterium]
MEYIQLTADNIEKEHICCAISNNKDPQVISKKGWLRDRMKEGLVFLKADIRGKCFIEYIPAENAWVPIEADNYMHINCFWVSGSCKGHGYGNDLLTKCIDDAKQKGKAGITVISSAKKKPFLSDPKYLAYKGFKLADTAEPFYELLYLPFSSQAQPPKWKACAKAPQNDIKGFSLYYSNGCPFTAKYVPILEQYAAENGITLTTIKIDSREKAQNVPFAWTNFALFYNGIYITNEMPNEKKFIGIMEQIKENEK